MMELIYQMTGQHSSSHLTKNQASEIITRIEQGDMTEDRIHNLLTLCSTNTYPTNEMLTGEQLIAAKHQVARYLGVNGFDAPDLFKEYDEANLRQRWQILAPIIIAENLLIMYDNAGEIGRHNAKVNGNASLAIKVGTRIALYQLANRTNQTEAVVVVDADAE